MGNTKKFKNLEVDSRGRVTLPKELREGVETFALEAKKDGTLRLIPQKQVSLEDANLIESLKKSVQEFKKKKLHKIPSKWMG